MPNLTRLRKTLPLLTAALLLNACGATNPAPPTQSPPTNPAGASSNETTPRAQSTPLPQSFANLAELGPDKLPEPEAEIKLMGVQIPVVLKPERKDNRLILIWVVDEKHDPPAEAEREEIQFSENTVSLARAAHQAFQPPVPLLKFPLATGDSYTWQGQVRTGKNLTPATAKITLDQEDLGDPRAERPALVANVTLSIAASPQAKPRNLKFYFEPGKGLAKVNLAMASVRRPRFPQED